MNDLIPLPRGVAERPRARGPNLAVAQASPGRRLSAPLPPIPRPIPAGRTSHALSCSSLHVTYT